MGLKRIVLTAPGMEQAKVLRNLTYKETAGRDHRADIYLPPDLSEGDLHPGAGFINGGCLPPNLLTQPKDWGIFISYGQLLAASGFTAITFNHRYYGADYRETAQEDVVDLISYVRDHNRKFDLDKSRINLWVFSCGGPLISWALRDTPTFIRSSVLYDALLDTQPKANVFKIPGKSNLDFSPVHQLHRTKREILPIFIARSAG